MTILYEEEFKMIKKEELKKQILEKTEKQKVIVITKKGVMYKEKRDKFVAVNADFLLKINGRAYSVQIRDGNVNSELPDNISVYIFILSKHRVALVEADSTENREMWYWGGFDSDNSDISILGYMEYETFKLLIYCNSYTSTPLIKMDSDLKAKELKMLFEALYLLLTNKKEEIECIEVGF